MFGNILNKYALLMGNHLESCKEDVKRLDILLTKKGFNCESIFDCNPEKELVSFLNRYKFTEDDLVYIHFSGHGQVFGKKINNKMEMISTWIDQNFTDCYSYNIDKILSSLICKFILISDSCHSGNFGNFYTGIYPSLFISSSSIIQKSGEYKIGYVKNAGAITCFLEFILRKINIEDLDKTFLNENLKFFYKKYKIKSNPVVKYKNIN